MSRLLNNLFHGFASILNVWPESKHQDYYIRLHQSEADALNKDWRRVGSVLWSGLNYYSQQVPQSNEPTKKEKQAR